MQMERKTRGRWRRWLSSLVTVLAIAYPVALLLVVVLLRWVGERWWVTSVALYLPRLGFAAPLVILLPLLLLTRRWRLVMLQGVSLVLLLFPLLGLSLSWRSEAAGDEPALRVLTYNVDSGNGGFPQLAYEILSRKPNLVFIQELPPWRFEEMKALLAPHFPNIDAEDQFMVASTFRIVSRETPPRIPFYGQLRSPRFRRYVIETSLGPITFFNVHTVSPRGAFYAMRGQGLRKEIASGRLFTGAAEHEIQSHAALRALQVAATVDMAEREKGPVMIVGDANLPTLSPARARYLGRFQDGFAEAGLGFGYSYPAKLPWMRIDLLLATEHLEFKRVEVGDARISDHLSVFGELVARKR